MTGSEPTLREAAQEFMDAVNEGRSYTNKMLRLRGALRRAALPPAAPDAEHEALRDRLLAWAHRYLAAVATGSPESYQRDCWQALVEARDALDAYLDDHPALLAKYEALWGAIEEKG